eukprot:2334313-Prymnesium_polylepis.1
MARAFRMSGGTSTEWAEELHIIASEQKLKLLITGAARKLVRVHPRRDPRRSRPRAAPLHTRERRSHRNARNGSLKPSATT